MRWIEQSEIMWCITDEFFAQFSRRIWKGHGFSAKVGWKIENAYVTKYLDMLDKVAELAIQGGPQGLCLFGLPL